MNIIYFGIYSNQNFFDQIISITKAPFSVAQHKFERGIIYGLIKNGVKISKAYCVPALKYDKIYNKIYIKSQNVSDNEINVNTLPILKIPFLGKISLFIYIFLKFLFIKQSKYKEKPVFIISLNYIPVALPLLLVSKIRKFKCIILMTDCARNSFELRKSIVTGKFRKIALRFKKNIAEKVERQYSGYVFLTNHMNCIINKSNRPNVIVEGVYDEFGEDMNISLDKSSRIEKREKILLYSGSLFEQYGIDKILEVMNYVDDNIILHIYGDGPFKNKIIALADTNSKIKYMGFINQKTLNIKLKKADLLINLRNPEYEYTKLSFPSKMIDYMVSGTPVFTTRLKGIPDEYYNYVYYVDTYDTNEIAHKISYICNVISHDEHSLLAKKSRDYIIENKNVIVQTKKIVDLIESMNSHEN